VVPAEDRFLVPADQLVHYIAAAGERNAPVFTHPDSFTVVVVDHAAPLAAGQWCTAVDLHTVRCVKPHPVAPPFPFGLGTVDLRTGDLDDAMTTETPPTTPPAGNEAPRFFLGMIADAGPGDDVVMSGAGGWLDGGSGRDAVHNGTGTAHIIDADTDPDEIGGGRGFDTLRYPALAAPFSLDVRTGRSSLGDTVRDVEWIAASAPQVTLLGDDTANSLGGLGRGPALVVGRGGRDGLGGGPADDTLLGGPGNDGLGGGGRRGPTVRRPGQRPPDWGRRR
jgi:hypothetical protein